MIPKAALIAIIITAIIFAGATITTSPTASAHLDICAQNAAESLQSIWHGLCDLQTQILEVSLTTLEVITNTNFTLVAPGETVTVEVSCFDASHVPIGNIWTINATKLVTVFNNATMMNQTVIQIFTQSNIPGVDTGGIPGLPTSISSGDSLTITVTNNQNLTDLTIEAIQACATFR